MMTAKFYVLSAHVRIGVMFVRECLSA